MSKPEQLTIKDIEAAARFIVNEGSLQAYSAVSAIQTLLQNWKDAMADGTPPEKLVGDIQRVQARLSQFSWVVNAMLAPGSQVTIEQALSALEQVIGTNRDADPAAAVSPDQEIKQLTLALREANGLVSTLTSALNDASSVVDKGPDEEYAYQAELEAARAYIKNAGLPDVTPSRQTPAKP